MIAYCNFGMGRVRFYAAYAVFVCLLLLLIGVVFSTT